jgi:hypothetical protein
MINAKSHHLFHVLEILVRSECCLVRKRIASFVPGRPLEFVSVTVADAASLAA